MSGTGKSKEIMPFAVSYLSLMLKLFNAAKATQLTQISRGYVIMLYLVILNEVKDLDVAVN
jgi:hypothetical protein